MLLKQLNQYFPPPPFFSSPHALTKFFSSQRPRNNIFPLRTVFYLITNHSIKTCIFWISFICIYFFLFFFAAKFCQQKNPPICPPPPIIPKFKMKNTPHYSPSRLSSEQTQKTRLFGIMIGLTFGVCRDCDFFK